MTKISGQSFLNAVVQLDGHEYEGCSFNSCIFEYSASDRFVLTDNQISLNCRFIFRGAAADTLSTLQAIYAMGEWGRAHVWATFQTVAPDLKKLN